MQRLFVAAPFSGLLNPQTGLFDSAFREFLEALVDRVSGPGRSVFLAHRREAWGDELMTADECTPLDFRAMCDADLVCAVLGDGRSGGVHVELGWASALGKPILLVLRNGIAYSPLVLGLSHVTEVRTVSFEEFTPPAANLIHAELLAFARLLNDGSRRIGPQAVAHPVDAR